MEIYSSNEHYKLYHGNMLDMLEVIEPKEDIPTGQTSIFDFIGENND